VRAGSGFVAWGRCGGRGGDRRRRNQYFPFPPKQSDAVFPTPPPTHHGATLPTLAGRGLRGPIYCPPATRALAGVMLGDAAKIQEEDAAYLERKRLRGQPQVEPLYDGRDVYLTLRKMEAIPYDRPVEISRGLEVTFVDA